MKLLIATDMEGISGVTDFNHTNPEHKEYGRFRQLMTADVNAAIEGAARAGADEIIVTDGHWNGLNILLEELDGRARLNAGLDSPFGMIQGIDQGVDAVIFIGYHARMGSLAGVLDHTWSSFRVENIWLNGSLVGETALNGAVCGHFGAPVLMVSGDQTLAAEASQWIPGVETVVVKQATSRLSAECLPLEISQRLIRETAGKAVLHFKHGQAPGLLKIAAPVTLTVEFIKSQMADSASIFPHSKRLDGRTLEIVTKDMLEAYFSLDALVGLVP